MDPLAPVIADRPPDGVRKIFYNARGLRAGWRLLIFLIIVLLLGIIANSAIGAVIALMAPKQAQVLKSGPPNPPVMLFSELVSFLTIVFATWVMSRIERRSMGEYGLPLRTGALSRFFRGYVFWGFIPLTLLLSALRLLHAFYFGPTVLHGMQIVYWAAFWGLVFLLVGLFEEYLLRGYALFTLADGIGFWPAAIFLAAMFAFAHSRNPGENRIGILMTSFFAIFASIALWRTGNLWLAVGAHAGWDWGESYFYGVSDSGLQLPGHLLNPHSQGPEWLTGGTVGPEGSVLALVALTLMSIGVAIAYRQGGALRRPVLYPTPAPPAK